MIDQLAAVWLPVSDMSASVAFYRDSLGLDVIEHGGDWSEVTAGDQRIGLNGHESPGGEGGAIIAFSVDGQLEQTVDELKGRGVTFTGEISEHPWGRIATFADPDGNDLQLYASPA